MGIHSMDDIIRSLRTYQDSLSTPIQEHQKNRVKILQESLSAMQEESKALLVAREIKIQELEEALRLAQQQIQSLTSEISTANEENQALHNDNLSLLAEIAAQEKDDSLVDSEEDCSSEESGEWSTCVEEDDSEEIKKVMEENKRLAEAKEGAEERLRMKEEENQKILVDKKKVEEVARKQEERIELLRRSYEGLFKRLTCYRM